MFILFFYFSLSFRQPDQQPRIVPASALFFLLTEGFRPLPSSCLFIASFQCSLRRFAVGLFPDCECKGRANFITHQIFRTKNYVIKHLFSTHFHISHYDTINYALQKISQKCDYFFSFFGAAFSNHSSRRKTMRCTPPEKRAEDMRKCPICDVFSTCAPTQRHSS